MKRFRIITFIAGRLLAASELTRWWRNPLLVPRLDHLLDGSPSPVQFSRALS
jgi:hypothetical protein